MPLEVRELVIRVAIEEPVTGNPGIEKQLQALKQTIIRECMEEILEKLENKADR